MAPVPPERRAQKLQAIAAGPLSSSLAAISAASRAIPAGKDFHFYNSFPEFSGPVAAVAADSAALLSSVGSSAHLGLPSPNPDADPYDSADWIVSVHDEVFELVDASLDEFRAARSERSAAAVAAAMEADGFQLVSGKKKKQGAGNGDGGEREEPKSSVRVASKDPRTGGVRPRVPFHLPYIPRPQDEYGFIVNNSNFPFEHVWLQRCEDGGRLIHPMVCSVPTIFFLFFLTCCVENMN